MSNIAWLSKFYEPLSLCLLTLTRVFIAKGLDGHPEPASLVFPMLVLKLINRPIKLVIILAHFYITQYLLYGTFEVLWAPVGVLMFIITEYMKDRHVIIITVASNLAAQVFLRGLAGTWDTIPGETMKEVAYSVLLIFLNGPLRVFLDIKEGKTSIKKIVEDYEDERTL